MKNPFSWLPFFKPSEELASSPIFLIGAPRSGTTIIFEAFSRHPKLGTRFNFHQRLPDHPIVSLLVPLLDNRCWSLVGQKEQHGEYSLFDRLAPWPVEDYEFWDRLTEVDFSRSFLKGVTASEAASHRVRGKIVELLRYEGRQRFTAKFTGPPRIGYLRSIFPDARFIHVIRDGRAVVDSLLRVDFWRDGGGFEEPWWKGGVDGEEVRAWRQNGSDPAALAAFQWRTIVEGAVEQAGELADDQYIEVRYEDFVSESHGVLTDLYGLCELSDEASSHRYMNRRMPEFRNMNYKYRENLSGQQIEEITRIMSRSLERFGYDTKERTVRPSRSAG